MSDAILSNAPRLQALVRHVERRESPPWFRCTMTFSATQSGGTCVTYDATLTLNGPRALSTRCWGSPLGASATVPQPACAPH
jgi:hypothetical protein